MVAVGSRKISSLGDLDFEASMGFLRKPSLTTKKVKTQNLKKIPELWISDCN